jgi:uncharacterized protein DUF2844
MICGEDVKFLEPSVRRSSNDLDVASFVARLPDVNPMMMKIGRALVGTGAITGCLLGAPKNARATLGADVASIAANEQRLDGARQVLKLASGERHDLQLRSGIVVHQYVSPGGAVYALTWRGPRMPDLRELLGPYFEQLARRDLRPWSGHHRVSLVGSDLVVHSSGHRGSFAGRAWVPSLVPPGIDIDETVE